MNLKNCHDTQQGFVQFIIPAPQWSTSLVSHRSSQDSTKTSSIYLPPNWQGGQPSRFANNQSCNNQEQASKTGSIYPRRQIHTCQTHGPMPNTHLCITYLPLYNVLFSTLDLFAMTIHVASFSLKGSSYCNHSHPCHQVQMTCPTSGCKTRIVTIMEPGRNQ